MLKTLYKFELRKLFYAKINILALTGAIIMLVFLAAASISEARPVSREAAGELNGRAMDGQLIDELRPALRYENGTTVVRITADYEKYVPVVDVVDVLMTAADNDLDLTGMQGDELYDLREKEINQRIEKQGLTEEEKGYWYGQEAQVQKPFIYMNQLLLCSHHGKMKLYMIKLASGFTWILAAAVLLFLSILIPFSLVFGMEGMGEMLQLVKPLSMLPYSIGHMLVVYMGIYYLCYSYYSGAVRWTAEVPKTAGREMIIIE